MCDTPKQSEEGELSAVSYWFNPEMFTFQNIFTSFSTMALESGGSYDQVQMAGFQEMQSKGFLVRLPSPRWILSSWQNDIVWCGERDPEVTGNQICRPNKWTSTLKAQ